MKEDMSLSNLGTVALHAAKVPTNVFSSTLICILTLDYIEFYLPSKFQVHISYIIFVLCSGQNMMDGRDGRTDEWTDKAAAICSPVGGYKKDY